NDAAELRALYHLAGSYYETGEVAEALELYRQGAARSVETGRKYAPYGMNARILAGLAAYTLGRWEEALRIADTTGERTPAVADSAMAAIEMHVAAGRGDPSGLALLPRARRGWATDAMVFMLGGGAAMELYGQLGQLDQAWLQHQRLTEELNATWTDVQARIRRSGLMIGIAADLAGDDPESQDRWADRADWLVAEVEEIVADAQERRPLGVESAAWWRRVWAERLRLDQRLGLPVDGPAHVAAWRTTVDGFRRFPNALELARSRARLAAALRAVGELEESRQWAEQARADAERLGAGP